MYKFQYCKRELAFTLAEILTVLLVIGVITTLTIPSLLKSTQESGYKTAYKKAYSAISDICTTAFIADELPDRGSNQTVGSTYAKFFALLA